MNNFQITNLINLTDPSRHFLEKGRYAKSNELSDNKSNIPKVQNGRLIF